jgi:hypothetical protein
MKLIEILWIKKNLKEEENFVFPVTRGGNYIIFKKKFKMKLNEFLELKICIKERKLCFSSDKGLNLYNFFKII